MVGRVGRGRWKSDSTFPETSRARRPSRERAKIETSNKSTGNPFKMEVDGPRILRERERENMCVRISECIPLDWWMVSVISDEVFIGDFIFDSWIRFQCLNKFYIQFKLMGSLIFDGIFYLVIIWLFFLFTLRWQSVYLRFVKFKIF